MTFKVQFQSVLLQIKFLWRKIYGKLGIPLSSKYLPVQSQQRKHLKKVWNMCKFNSTNTRTISVTLFWCVYYWIWAYLTPFYWCLYCWLWTNKCLFGDNLFVIDWNSSLTLNNTRTISVTFSSVFIIDFEHISRLFTGASIVDFEQTNVCLVIICLSLIEILH